MRVDINPKLLRWARERAGLTPDDLAGAFPKLRLWESREAQPTLKQLERFARVTHAPVGYLFLQEPPVETLPIPDFRTVGGRTLHRLSPDLLDTVHICQQRQEWYRDYMRASVEDRLAFVGSAVVTDGVVETAGRMREALAFDVAARRELHTWEAALRQFIGQADALGVLVMCNGVVMNNNRRRLDPDEFRGFAMADPWAPLVFVNGADTKAAQMFTLAHELAHIWLGQSGVSDAQPSVRPGHRVERWCNEVAAELLVPLAIIRREYREEAELWSEVRRLARYFKVSTLVILRRIRDTGGLTDSQFQSAYSQELARLKALPKGSGGDFYLTQGARIGKRFARALVASTLEGQTLHRDAFRMLGFSKLSTFRELGRSLGVAP
jgi:Zn-dependent peptidase ImmA (M78 family)/transcriptional regulator with XRE-family HTH domain